MRVLATAAVAFSLSAIATSVHAEGEKNARAEATFAEAKALFERGELVKACETFAASDALDPGIGTMLWLGDCWEKSSRFASALRAFRVAESRARAAVDQREQLAHARALALEPRANHLVVDCGTARSLVEVAGTSYPCSAGGAIDILADGGEISGAARFDGGSEQAFRKAVDPRSHRAELKLTRPTLADGSAPATPIRVPIGWVTAAVGTALAGSSIVFGLLAKGAYDDQAERCVGGCDDVGFRARVGAVDDARLATIGTIAGSVLLVGGLTLALFPRGAQKKERAALSFSPSGVSMRATF